MKIFILLLGLWLCHALHVFSGEGTAVPMHLDAMDCGQLFELSGSYKHRNLTDSAMYGYMLLSSRYTELAQEEDRYLCVKAYREVGTLYHGKCEYAKALDFLTQGVEYCEENGFRDLLPGFYNNIGCVYSALNDFTLSISCFEKGQDISRELGDTYNEKILLMNLACHCSHENIKDKAVKYNSQLDSLYGAKDPSIKFYLYLNEGWIYYKDSCYVRSADRTRKALDYAERIGIAPYGRAVVCETLGNVYLNMPDKRDSAYYYLMESYRMASEHGLLGNLRNILRVLAQCHEQDGHDREALQYKIKYWQLSDSLLGSDSFNQTKSRHFLNEIEENYEKIRLLNKEKQEKMEQIRRFRIQIACVISVTVVLMAVVIIIAVQRRKLYNAYKELFNRNIETLKAETPQEKPDNAEETPAASYEMSSEQRQLIRDRLESIMAHSTEIYDCDFSLMRLAELAGTNHHYLSQVINETYGKNFRALLNEYRIKEAQRRLLDENDYGNYTIKAIAESVGYKSHSSFVALFRKATGLTPSVYQQLARSRKKE